MDVVPGPAVPEIFAAGGQFADEVVEVLPATSTSRTETQRLRKQLAARPSDPKLAHAVAARYLAQAHELGDPRFAGLALAALRA